MERNPIKIIYYARASLLPGIIWIFYDVLIIVLLVLTFAIPDKILYMNYSVFDTGQFIVISLSALTFILSMFMFGRREVYTVEDFSQFYVENRLVYYGYLSDYLFPAVLWMIVAFLSICKLVIVVSISVWILDLLRIIFLSVVLLAIFATVTLVIHNMNRMSNKIAVESERIKRAK